MNTTVLPAIHYTWNWSVKYIPYCNAHLHAKQIPHTKCKKLKYQTDLESCSLRLERLKHIQHINHGTYMASIQRLQLSLLYLSSTHQFSKIIYAFSKESSKAQEVSMLLLFTLTQLWQLHTPQVPVWKLLQPPVSYQQITTLYTSQLRQSIVYSTHDR